METITITGTDTDPVALITNSMGDNGPSVLIGLGVLVAVLLILRRMSRKARAQSNMAQDTGISFAASVEIPPYVDTSSISSIAAKIDPAEAAERLSDTWMDARRKVEANPLYNPNSHECMARDAIEIERVFCGGQLARYLAKQPAEAFERFAGTAQTLGSPKVAALIGEAKKLAIKGHSEALQSEPRKGEAWAEFRRQIANLEAEIRSANMANGNAGRIVTLADAYMSEIAA
ncbi:MAG: hypothetical protein HKP37_05240 [Boseongicola sp.]|nr:hypothetical protein [Boseongicola sp.]